MDSVSFFEKKATNQWIVTKVLTCHTESGNVTNSSLWWKQLSSQHCSYPKYKSGESHPQKLQCQRNYHSQTYESLKVMSKVSSQMTSSKTKLAIGTRWRPCSWSHPFRLVHLLRGICRYGQGAPLPSFCE